MMKSLFPIPTAVVLAGGIAIFAAACAEQKEAPSRAAPATRETPAASAATAEPVAAASPGNRDDAGGSVHAEAPVGLGGQPTAGVSADHKASGQAAANTAPTNAAAAVPEAADTTTRTTSSEARKAAEPRSAAAIAAGSRGRIVEYDAADALPAAAPPPPAAMAFQPAWIARPPIPDNTERYQHLSDNPLHMTANDPVSTFSLDVDTGSYSNVRRFLAQGHLPPGDAVRVEEMVNYFPYDYPRSEGENPFGVRTELAPCPWQGDHWLMRVAVKADDVTASAMPPSNLVFLVDVSGSMNEPAKLPLLQSSLKMLVEQLRREDRVSLVVYAGREAVVLEPTAGDDHGRISRAIDELSAGGSTAGEAGIRLAYRMAREHLVKGGINRVLLATDGDFNVGLTDFQQLKDMVTRERESGVQLSTLGFGTGNTNEELMEQLADVGNGSYAYIDNLMEGRKVLVDQVRSTLVTVAKDVKIQVEFNPAVVSEYRLIGYENHILAREDFNNDRIDAGDVGAGQSVTALYELTPVGAPRSVDPLRYGSAPHASSESGSDDAVKPTVGRAVSMLSADGTAPSAEVAFVRLRYKSPDANVSRLMEAPVPATALLPSFDKAGDDFRFATAVAGFGQLLRGGKRTGTWSFDDVLAMATTSRGRDEFGYRSEFLSLVRMAKVSS